MILLDIQSRRKGMDGDLLSSLPDELLLHILSLTKSYKSAVKCSALSKRWKTLYTLLPCLYFHDTMFGIDPEAMDSADEYMMPYEFQKKYHKIVGNVSAALFRHQGDVKTFYLSVYHDLSMWHGFLHHVGNYHIEHLTLVYNLINTSPVPLWIFSCSHLQSITLIDFYSMSLPDTPSVFSSLRICNLNFTMMESPVWLSDFLMKCPVLEYLSFWAGDYWSDTVEIQNSPLIFSSHSLLDLKIDFADMGSDKGKIIIVQAPKLLCLCLDICYDNNDTEIAVYLKVHAPKLMKLTLPENQYVELECDRLPRELKTGILKAKWNSKALLSDLVFAKFTVSNGVDYLSPIGSFSALKTLHLMYIEGCAMEFWNMLAKLHNLESLTLENYQFISEENQEASMEKTIDRKVELPSLKEVSISMKDSIITEGKCQVFKRILENSPVLQTLCIVMENKMANKKECFEFFQQLLQPSQCLNIIERKKSIEFLIQKSS